MNLFGIDINIENIVKLYEKGKIAKMYEQMYYTANKLAREDLNTFRIKTIFGRKDPSEFIEYLDERKEYHMREMKKLLDRKLKQK
ncbi:MAG: hypothetical protein ACOCQ4_00380 [bacterium]